MAGDLSSFERDPASRTQGNLALNVAPGLVRVAQEIDQDAAWRGELSRKVEAYRTRRRKLTPNAAQSALPFEEPVEEPPARPAVGVAEPPAEEEFSFTIAIGRPAPKRAREDHRMVIDVSAPPNTHEASPEAGAPPEVHAAHSGMYPVASLDERRLAALIDACCLLFAYGGFLALFGSLGGQFTLSKLSAAVYMATFAIVYLQYFALFTIFGGTTPGMMLRGLQVMNFSGESPAPRQMLLRAAGYLLSAGTFFLGFFWALWDEDVLTWHDRLSRTYLSSAETLADLETQSVAHSR